MSVKVVVFKSNKSLNIITCKLWVISKAPFLQMDYTHTRSFRQHALIEWNVFANSPCPLCSVLSLGHMIVC